MNSIYCSTLDNKWNFSTGDGYYIKKEFLFNENSFVFDKIAKNYQSISLLILRT